ncbi:MAG TPA: YIP1 family protein [Bacillales bacterium]|nr:YIP1 family protein [Bacillales bacterium]
MEETDTQVHHVRLLKGIIKPSEEFAGMREADRIEGLGWRVVVLSIFSGIFAGLTVYILQALGLADEINKQFQMSGTQAAEMNEQVSRAFTLVTGIFGGLVGPVITMAVAALIFLIFFSDIGYKKLFAIELYLQFIGLIHAVVAMILIFVFQSYSDSFLNLGAITQLFTENLFINSFFGGISIYLIWKVYVQIKAYCHSSKKSMSYIAWTLVILNIVFLLIAAGFAVLGQQMVDQLQQIQPPQQ